MIYNHGAENIFPHHDFFVRGESGMKTDLVNVFHGTGEIDLPAPEGVAASWHFIKGLCGNTSPGAVLPFGKYTVAPYSGGYSSGYGMNKKNCGGPVRKLGDKLRLRGFAHFQNSGTGASNIYYNYAVVKPYYGEAALDYGAEQEKAGPGYYSVRLAETGILCELTVTKICAMHRYTFGAPGGRISIDFSNDGLYADEEQLRGKAEDLCIEKTSDKTITASGIFQGVRLCFALSFEGDGKLSEENVFCLDRPGTVTLSFSASASNPEGALKELSLSKMGFDEAKEEANRLWEETLSKIDVSDEDKNELELFYSNLYHSLTKPSDWGGNGFLWDGAPFVVDIVTMWDIYKTQLPLIFTLFPEISEHFLAMVIRLGLERGRMPHMLMLSSKLNSEADQARFLGAYAIYDAWKRGVRADWNSALDALLSDLSREDFADFRTDGACARTTHTLDMAEGCAAGAELAEALGREEDKKMLAALSENYLNAFDPETGLLHADREYYEGNHWNYSFRPLRNMEKRIGLCGEDNFEKLLDRFFGFTHGEDVSARFEGFNNETDMETPYAYHYVGKHEKLCEIISAADRFSFRDSELSAGVGAIPGNNDSGGLSSCYIWNCLGLFPVSGQDLMLLSCPKFKKTTLYLSNGKKLTVKKTGNGTCPVSVSLNGVPLESRKITVTQMMLGGEIEFKMQ